MKEKSQRRNYRYYLKKKKKVRNHDAQDVEKEVKEEEDLARKPKETGTSQVDLTLTLILRKEAYLSTTKNLTGMKVSWKNM